MIRFLCFLLNKPYETCKSCETLKEQLQFEREEKRQLTETLLNILQPKAIESAPVVVNEIANSSMVFSRRRAAMESRDREEARIKKMSATIGRPDNLVEIDKLEKELDIPNEG